jgi:mevalonate kinase
MRDLPGMSQTMHLQAFGPGKVILLGEHGVVYGHPALVAPISRGVHAYGEPAPSTTLELPDGLSDEQLVTLERAFKRGAKLAGNPKVSVSVEGDLPLSMGLGSSGALSVAIARVLLQARHGKVAPKQLEATALEMEREFHGTPSGVDHTCSARGQLLLFTRGQARVITSPRPLKVLVALVGPRAATKATVGALRERQARWPQRYARIFAEMGKLAREGARAVTQGDLEALGDLMNLNQGLLSALQLTHSRIDEMVYRLRLAGALGAKLTGAGGDGGAVVGLFPEPEPVVARLRKEGIDCFASQLAGPGAL